MTNSHQHAEVAEFSLRPDETAQAVETIRQLLARHPSPAESGFWEAMVLHSHDLAPRLREFLLQMRYSEDSAAFLVSGFQVDDTGIGPTPAAWGMQKDPSSTLIEEAWLVLCGSLLGDLFGWATQQAGALIHDIVPTRQYEDKQVGGSSSTRLWWHTEEAFHPLRCDYIGLMCLRNHRRVPTTFASIDDVKLEEGDREILFERHFTIRPDDSHLEQNQAASEEEKAALLSKARDRMQRMNKTPNRVSLLYGSFEAPYLSIDPFYMSIADDDPQVGRAYRALHESLESSIRDIVLEPGQILFVDNYRAVHGRRPFTASYDGTDRWLKRINITRDLRKSRAARTTSESRIIY